MIRELVVAVLVVTLAGCASPSPAPSEETPASQPTSAPSTSPSPEQPAAPKCITVSATWVGHIQYFMEDGYAITRAAASPAQDGYTTIAAVYTSPAGEQLLGGWGTGGDPSSDAVVQVFPVDDVTASHTVVMMPRMNIVAAAGAGSSDATACLG